MQFQVLGQKTLVYSLFKYSIKQLLISFLVSLTRMCVGLRIFPRVTSKKIRVQIPFQCLVRKMMRAYLAKTSDPTPKFEKNSVTEQICSFGRDESEWETDWHTVTTNDEG